MTAVIRKLSYHVHNDRLMPLISKSLKEEKKEKKKKNNASKGKDFNSSLLQLTMVNYF